MQKTICELFAGVGGFRLGFDRLGSGWETTWFSQWEPGAKTQWAHDCYIQHFGDICARNRQDKEKGLKSDRSLNLLGNKALLEKRINIRASDYRFEDKKKFYKGFISQQGKEKHATMIWELTELAREKEDFTEEDIVQRNEQIFDAFFAFLHDNGLIADTGRNDGD